jgi:hypothetical protein
MAHPTGRFTTWQTGIIPGALFQPEIQEFQQAIIIAIKQNYTSIRNTTKTIFPKKIACKTASMK